MHTPAVKVNPATLAWARKTASASLEQAAKKVNVDTSRIEAWESGAEQPSLAQLRHLAELYKRPLAFFLLDKLPTDFTVMKNYRRLPERDELVLSFELAGQLRQALLRRELAVDLSSAIGEEPTRFDLRASQTTSPVAVAAKVREQLGIGDQVQVQWGDDRAAFRAWRAAVEAQGVLTFQTTRVDVEEMRGLSVFNSVFPVVLLNASDAVRGRIFTLMHELGHLVLRTETSMDSSSTLNDAKAAEEVWCNEFAGALLVPASLLSWRPNEVAPTRFDWAELRIQSNRLKVSRDVILRRLLSLGRLNQKQYQALRHELGRLTIKPASKGGPVAQDVLVLSRLGLPFVRKVVVAYKQQRITLSDVSSYLDVRLKYVRSIEDRVLSGDYSAEGATG